MAYSGRQGQRAEEMFLNKPQDSAVIEPLRITKRGSPASPVPSVNSQQNGSVTGPSASSAPTYPLPSLPDPNRARNPATQSTTGAPAPYPYPDPKRVASPEQRANASNYGNATGRSGSANSASSNPSTYPAPDARQPSALAARRGNAPKPLPDSPGPEAPDQDGVFQSFPQGDRTTSPRAQAGKSTGEEANPYPDYHQQYWPPPGGASSGSADTGRLSARNRDPDSLNRLSSTASTSTTKAQRGSPPPSETPIIPAGYRQPTDIEQRYAAAGIAGTATLTNLQAQSIASQQRAANYAGRQPSGQGAAAGTPQRPWTPTEAPGSSHPAPTIYQGPGEANASPPSSTAQPSRPTGLPAQPPTPGRIPQNALENDIARLQVSEEPPPAYSQTPGQTGAGHYGQEKSRLRTSLGGAAVPVAAAAAVAATGPQHPNQAQHPAFANDPRQGQADGPARQASRSSQTSAQRTASMRAQSPQVNNAPPASPPPLPEGWIAHIDPNSGQYYYIHLATQSTQWEFPKGPTPLNLNDAPLSPVGSLHNPLVSPGLSFSGKPLASPGLPMSPGYDTQSVMSMNTSATGPAGFTGPPPSSGVDMYKVAATNGVYFGPYLRYTNMDLERGIWLGSILLVTDAPQPPTIHIHQSVDLSPNPRQLKAQDISRHQRWTFYKYDVDLQMDESPAKWTYAITSHLGCTRYEFLVAGRWETNWRFIATSGNDFSLNVSANDRARLGGVGFMWKDIMQKHMECGGFHCQLGLGSQIYADRLWKEIPSLRQWTATSGKEARKNATWAAAHEEDVTHAYFHYYTSHFDQPHVREAFAQIPHVLTIDDHDM